MPRNLSFFLVAVVIVGAGALLYSGGPSELANVGVNNTAAVLNFEPRESETAVVGTLTCTPIKSGEIVPEGQCVMGLRGDDGKFYSLNTANMQDARGDMTNLQKVRVVGTSVPADTSSEEVGNYSYDSVFSVRTIESVD